MVMGAVLLLCSQLQTKLVAAAASYSEQDYKLPRHLHSAAPAGVTVPLCIVAKAMRDRSLVRGRSVAPLGTASIEEQEEGLASLTNIAEACKISFLYDQHSQTEQRIECRSLGLAQPLQGDSKASTF